MTDAELEEVLAAASVGKYAAESDNTNELTEPLPPPDPVNVQNAAVLADVLGAVPRGGWLYLTDPHDDSLHRICLVTLPQGGTTDQVEAPEIAEHVVVVDDRNDSPGHDLYYHRGGGPFSLSEAEPVKDPEQLRELVLEWDGTYQPEADQYARKKKDAAGQTNFLDPQGGGSAGGEWTPYTGPRGGKGWKSNRTGRVLYRDEMPGGHEHEGEHEDDPGPRPEPGQDAQGKQAPAAAAPETPEAKAARLRKEYQELGTRAPAFRAWFGDWEHDAAHASKVIDPETGEPQQQAPVEHSVVVENLMPKVVYHGTPWDRFDEFLKSKLAKGEKLFYGPGFYFTDAAAIAEDYKQHGSGLVDRAGGKLAVPVERVRRELLPALKQKAAKVAADLQYTVKELRLTQDRVAQRSLQRQAEDLESRQYQLHQLEAMILDSTESNVGVAVAKGEHILNAEFGNQFAGWVERPKGHVFSVYLNIRKPFDIDRGKIATADLPEPARSRFRIKQTRPILLVSDEAVTPTDQHWQQMHAALESLPNVSMNFTWQQMKQMMTAEPQRLWGLYQSHPEFRKALRPYNISFQPDVHEVQRPHASYEEVVRQGGLSKSGLQKHLAAQGYDGITHVGHYGSRRGKKIEGVQQHRVWIAFEPHQIKAVDNAGTFDPSNPKIDLARADQPA
ncbi:MAG: hypothetical protein JO110_24085, partial [Acetobacteraceae bacterium]|nr:hypothetical protein [Acetobacteraceae bacterium]